MTFPEFRKFSKIFFLFARENKSKISRARPGQSRHHHSLSPSSNRCRSRVPIMANLAQCAPVRGIVRVITVSDKLPSGARVVISNRGRPAAQHTHMACGV
jgi:hypothetical protein